MTMRRPLSQATSREGVNFVRSLVERANCIFHEIDLGNDLGIDAYLEFIVDENATGCCVAVQVKSGTSYRTATGRYALRTDPRHLAYWNSHTLPIFGIVFDPERRKAFWVDITAYIKLNPGIIENGPYLIEVPDSQGLAEETFDAFREYCLNYREQYSREANFGRALELLSSRSDEQACFDALYALFSYHRQQFSMWYYLISVLSNYHEHPILPWIITRLSHLPGHGDIFWSKRNLIDPSVRRRALAFMSERLDRRDAIAMLSAIDENGIQRGSLGQSVHAIIDVMLDADVTMESIAVDQSLDEFVRRHAILLGVERAARWSSQYAFEMLNRIRGGIAGTDLWETVDWLTHELHQYGEVWFY